ncbi:hypothetical protein SCLCIDRAFT_349420 [Scleroderma citrinum Foug A]|uniref:Uncharacterized protein n=1 Tax=Scleroderma citrinum Foug A TaxID=1036808 RepID=A0A0C3D1C8_9AGAM|nr:hypothetical protein SCLCIDRAFT_349420 [Scleroderma citrinum Foug A]
MELHCSRKEQKWRQAIGQDHGEKMLILCLHLINRRVASHSQPLNVENTTPQQYGSRELLGRPDTNNGFPYHKPVGDESAAFSLPVLVRRVVRRGETRSEKSPAGLGHASFKKISDSDNGSEL